MENNGGGGGEGRQRKLVVLVPFPLQGHITPMLQLGSILHSRGFSITIAHTHFNSPDPSNHPDFAFLPLPDGLSDLSEPPNGLIPLTSVLKRNCEAPLLESVTQIMQRRGHQDAVDRPCIIYDGLMHFVEPVAHRLKLPSISMSCGCAANLLMFHLFPSLVMNGCLPSKNSDDLVPGLYPIRFKDLPIKDFSVDDLLWFAAEGNTKSSSAIILNTMDCLEQSFLTLLRKQHSEPDVPVFAIGPMHKIVPASRSSLLEEDTSCIEWLDKQSPNTVIYVSLGSLASMDEKELAEMAWGLARSEQSFLWVIRTESDPIASLPENYAEIVGGRGYFVKWAPQKQVLAHPAVGGFWSHCGWNSTLESIAEGVPMICRPCFGDQMVNARLVSHVLGVGIEMEDKLERVEIERAVRRLMMDVEGEEMRRKAMDFKEKFGLSIKKGGSSYSSLNDLVAFLRS